MQNKKVTLEQLLKQLNRSLHYFFTNVLIEAPQIIPPSRRESVEYWLNDQSLIKIDEEFVRDFKEVEEEKIGYSIASRILSRDVLALFHFYQVTHASYQPKAPYLSRCLLPESKEENALSHSIKTGHLSFEVAQLLFLLMQHGQLLLIVHEAYGFLNSEKNYMSFMANILWYRGVFWISIHSMALIYSVKFLWLEKKNIQSLINFIFSNKRIDHNSPYAVTID